MTNKAEELMRKSDEAMRMRLFKEGAGDDPQPHGGARTVKVIGDKVISDTRYRSVDEEPFFRVIFRDVKGNKYYYQKPVKTSEGRLHYFVKRFAELDEGDWIEIEGKKDKEDNSFIDISNIEDDEELEEELESNTKSNDENSEEAGS